MEKHSRWGLAAVEKTRNGGVPIKADCIALLGTPTF